LTSELLVQSQKIKHILTGNLTKRLVTNPEFNGRQKEYLRAQIARIVHSTTICPDGLWDKNEDGDGIIPKEDDAKEIKSCNELGNLESWI